jgi:hypothetical protein
VSSVPVSLDQVACASPCARADGSALFATDERAAHSPHAAADKRAFELAVAMRPAVTLNGEARAGERSEQQYHAQQRRDDAFI